MNESVVAIYSYELTSFWQTSAGIGIIVGIIIVATGFIAGALWYRKRRQPLTLRAWAEREIEEIARSTDAESVNYRVFFGKVTFFIKQYLVRLYAWPVLDKTDSELLAFVEDKQEIPKKLQTQFSELFSYAQMVKFAGEDALRERAQDAIRILRQVVETLLVPDVAEKG